jgi:farnesyl-diphosphate farnesyltransferase
LPGTIAQQLEACIERYRQVATAHLAAGWAYTLALPKQAARVRLACAWPILIGIKTLQKQRKAESPASGVTVKISRAEVYRLLARTTLLYPTPHKWGRLFADVASASSFR